MQHMQEEKFEIIKKKNEICKKDEHDVVKLYINGTHTDYGCVICGMKSLMLTDFNSKE